MRRFFSSFLLILGLPLAATVSVAAPVVAQDMLRAAAVINDEVISVLDLDMRLRLAIFAAGQPDNAELRKRLSPQVMRALIDERLQSQEAERLGITVTDELVAAAAEEISQRNKLSFAKFAKILEGRGIIPSVFLEQVRGQLTWNALVTSRLRPSVDVSEDEVDDIVRRITANRGLKQRRVSEIFLAVDTALQEDEILNNAQRLFNQLRAGGSFPALARQFSEAASAARGGDLGWIQEGQLLEELDAALANMRPGTLSPPIRSLSGFHILLLRDERQTSLGDVMLHIMQVVFALPEGAGAERKQALVAQVEAARGRISGCAGLDELAAEIGSPGSGDLGTVKAGDLPPEIRNVVLSLPIGQASAPMVVPGGLGILVVCERTDSGVDRVKIRDRLSTQRLDMLARRYMRDLRRSANVDIRL
ncbi:MAG: peptidylprolyl isomerase [Alphaproteobacteria bacterium]